MDAFHAIKYQDFQQFEKDIGHRVSELEQLHNERLQGNASTDGKIKNLLGELKQSIEANKNFLSDPSARKVMTRLTEVTSKIENTGENPTYPYTSEIAKIFSENRKAAGAAPKKSSRTMGARAATRLETMAKEPIPKFDLIPGQTTQATKSKADPPNLFKIGADNSPNNHFLVEKELRSAAEASVYIAVDQSGQKMAIRSVNLNPTKKMIAEGAPENPTQDVQKTAAFEKSLKETGDKRTNHFCLKSELLVTYDKDNLPNFVFEVMPLAQMSIDKISTNEAFEKLSNPEKLKAFQFIGHQVLSGLEFLHENQWVHHDVKNDNLLLMRDGSIKLTDFGFTKRNEDPSKMKAEQLNPKFISPELASNKQVTGQSDVWSTGIALCELCGVKIPNIELSVLRNEKEATAFTQSLVSELNTKSPELADLVSQMLTFDPVQRITAKDALAHPFFKDVMTQPEFVTLMGIDKQ